MSLKLLSHAAQSRRVMLDGFAGSSTGILLNSVTKSNFDRSHLASGSQAADVFSCYFYNRIIQSQTPLGLFLLAVFCNLHLALLSGPRSWRREPSSARRGGRLHCKCQSHHGTAQ